MFFFFSSRRRHTRFSRDWSSDVCSSDLIIADIGTRVVGVDVGDDSWPGVRIGSDETCEIALVTRSEERRVGKEWRSRWSAEHYKKKRTGDKQGHQCTMVLSVVRYQCCVA